MGCSAESGAAEDIAMAELGVERAQSENSSHGIDRECELGIFISSFSFRTYLQ